MTLENRGTAVTTEMEALYKHRTTLTQIFNTIDKDRSGLISRDEFIEACKVGKCNLLYACIFMWILAIDLKSLQNMLIGLDLGCLIFLNEYSVLDSAVGMLTFLAYKCHHDLTYYYG